MSETIIIEADLQEDLVAGLAPGAKEEYALMVFRRATEGNPAYASVGEPVITFHDDVRAGFLTAKIAFEAERA